MTEKTPTVPPAAGASLARGAAATTLATAASRVTGFVRTVAVAGAMGTSFLANTYQTANTAPNIVFELVAAGVLTSVFVPTFVEHIVKGRRDEGWEAANALASVALCGLVGLSVLLALGAPLIMQLLTLGVSDQHLRTQEVELGTTFLRLFAPQVIFYGASMIMTGALQAHRKFWLPAFAPVFNNIVVTGVYLGYAALRGGEAPSVAHITEAEILLLGAGTTLGVVAMSISLVPQLARLGWRFRFLFHPRHPAVRRGARLGVWALGYAGGYQAGLIVVLLLANKIQGGVAAYQWAFTFFYLPHALFSIPIFSVLFTAMSEHVAQSDEKGLVWRLSDGLGMLGFILLPVAAFMIVASSSLAALTLNYGVMSQSGAALVGRVIAAFAAGLPMYSTFLVMTRAYYAVGDTRTPALVNMATVALASGCGALLFFVLPPAWAVPGLALGHSLAFSCGAAVLLAAFSRRVRSSVVAGIRARLVRSLLGALVALGVMAAVHELVPGDAKLAVAARLAATAVAGAVVYGGAMKLSRAPELGRVAALLPLRRTG
ncbi:MAG TPA: murein biosynthesis integral membrane protein MurJ [Actinomycetota bacterium]|nr:murein biosynthesis integral membrane protein MurJ [Actinomycetota bacterium]